MMKESGLPADARISPEIKRDMDRMWTATPLIDGFSEPECDQIYSGDYEAVLRRLRNMDDVERDTLITTRLMGGLGAASHDISDAEDDAMERNNQDKVSACKAAQRHLDDFKDKLLSLYKQMDMPASQRDAD